LTSSKTINQARQGSGFFSFGVTLSSLNNTPYVNLSFGFDNGAAEGVTFSSGLPPQDTPGLLMVLEEVKHDGDGDPPQRVPEPGTLYGMALALGLGLNLYRRT
jgi:hypothetical protein